MTVGFADQIIYSDNALASFCESYIQFPVFSYLLSKHCFHASKNPNGLYVLELERKEDLTFNLSKVISVVVHVISYLTLFPPLFAWTYREFYRRQQAFLILDNSSPSIEKIEEIRKHSHLNSISSTHILNTQEVQSNQMLYRTSQNICRANRVYWTPHPKFETDQGPFPDEAVNIFDPCLYGVKEFACLFQENAIKIFQRGTHNEFFRWLNGQFDQALAEHTIIEKFHDSKDVIFMNCADFVYFSLYSSGLLSKEQIFTIYQNYRSDSFRESNKKEWSGFKLDDFVDFDCKNPQGNPGDLLLCFDEKGEPIHILILGENGKGIGLWNTPSYSVSEVDLQVLQQQAAKNKSIFTYKYCPLMKLLEN